MASNKKLAAAKAAKQDEYYTTLETVNAELYYYTHDREDLRLHNQFRDKVVFCNCDDPEWSAFWQYFVMNFHAIGLKKLISTHYEASGAPSYKMEYTGKEMNGQQVWVKTDLQGNGDFRSEECIQIMKEADIICTNPPFSLFSEYIAQLIEYGKQFIIIGPLNAITYKDVFPWLKDNKMWIGHKPMGADMLFDVPPEFAEWLVKNKKEGSGYRRVNGVVMGRAQAIWYTNLDVRQRHEFYDVCDYYYGNEEKYPRYETIDGIDVKALDDIPCDYEGIMGVPKSFMGVYCADQFEIIGYEREDDIVKAGIKNIPESFLADYRAQGGRGHITKGMRMLCYYDNEGQTKVPFSRILIRNKHPKPRKGGAA